jgi:photoactive yellow protein
MSDAARDLYSFLRSKDFVSSDDEGDGTSDPPSNDADAGPDADVDDDADAFGALQTVASFDADDADGSDDADARDAGEASPNKASPSAPSASDASASDASASDASASDASASDASASEARAVGSSEGPALPFDDDATGERLKELSRDALDALDFGVIEVDDDGVVQFFNRYESQMSGVAPETATGKNFFTEVAPCSNNRLFVGRFKKGLRRGELDERFTYTYTYKMSPTLVDVRLYRDEDDRNWILVRQR